MNTELSELNSVGTLNEDRVKWT